MHQDHALWRSGSKVLIRWHQVFRPSAFNAGVTLLVRPSCLSVTPYISSIIKLSSHYNDWLILEWIKAALLVGSSLLMLTNLKCSLTLNKSYWEAEWWTGHWQQNQECNVSTMIFSSGSLRAISQWGSTDTLTDIGGSVHSTMAAINVSSLKHSAAQAF